MERISAWLKITLFAVFATFAWSSVASAQTSCANPGLFGMCATSGPGGCISCCDSLTQECWRQNIEENVRWRGITHCGVVEYSSLASWKQCVEQTNLVGYCGIQWETPTESAKRYVNGTLVYVAQEFPVTVGTPLPQGGGLSEFLCVRRF
jgi:hypothetical protein